MGCQSVAAGDGRGRGHPRPRLSIVVIWRALSHVLLVDISVTGVPTPLVGVSLVLPKAS